MMRGDTMTTSKPDALLARLQAIGTALAQSDHALALIGLGSVGIELDRLDDYSDIDFFVIVETGWKNEFLDHLVWLDAICPIAYAFRNTTDGYKLLFQDGIFCEFAVFDEPELRHIPFAPGRIVWKRAHIADSLCAPPYPGARPKQPSLEWSLGEIGTNLYVGLQRYHRGEKLSAMRFIQVYAVDRILELFEALATEPSAHRDNFALERRCEQRQPQLAQVLPTFTQGYERSPESAKAILAFLEAHFDIHRAMQQAIVAAWTPDR